MTQASPPSGGEPSSGGADDDTGPFDPADHTAAEVVDYVTANPNERQRVLDAEYAGKARSTLIAKLEAMA